MIYVLDYLRFQFLWLIPIWFQHFSAVCIKSQTKNFSQIYIFKTITEIYFRTKVKWENSLDLPSWSTVVFIISVKLKQVNGLRNAKPIERWKAMRPIWSM